MKTRVALLILGLVVLSSFPLSGSNDPGVLKSIAQGRATLSPQGRDFREEEVEIEGNLVVLIEDSVGGSRQLSYLDTDAGERYTLHFVSEAPRLMTGARVKVRGLKADKAIAVESGSRDVERVSGARTASTEATAALGNTLGAQRTVVLLVNFADKAVQPYTAAYAKNLVFTTTSNFDLENSYGQTWLTGDVFGWYTIPLSSTVCDTTALAVQAAAAATAAGVNLSNYTHHVYAFPNNACGWWGLGSVGGNPSAAWINGGLELQVVAHEMGHNFGLLHSHSLACGSLVLGTNCTTDEYGDNLDNMGYSSYHFSAYQKERLGWLDYGASPPLTTVAANGTYSIDQYEMIGSNPKALKIPRGTTGSSFYVEFRQGTGFDAALGAYPNISNGVVVHLASSTNPNGNNLLNMNPGPTPWNTPALTVGQTFTDAISGVTITVNSVSPAGASVSVALGATSPTPSPTPTPTSTQTAAPTQTPTPSKTPTPTPTPTQTPTPSKTPTPSATPTPAPPPPAVSSATILTSQVPGTNINTGGHELGARFTTSQSGLIVALRFWKAAADSGVHTGRLWTDSGTPLVSVVFTGETASGWQEQALPAPMAVTAGVAYRVSYNVNTGRSITGAGLASPISNGPLTAVSGCNNPVAGNFPGNLTANNLFADVRFQPGTTGAPTPTPTPAPPSSPSSATILTTQVPGTNINTGGHELGARFTSSQSGLIVALRFWKASADSGVHTGRLWTDSGTQLASVVFTGETASGWQEQALPAPVAVAAGMTYRVSYNVNTGRSIASAALAAPISNGPLTATSGCNNAVASNFPGNLTTNNLFADLRFQP